MSTANTGRRTQFFRHRVGRTHRYLSRHWKWIVPLVLVVALVAAVAVRHHVRHERLAYRLLAASPAAVTRRPRLVAFAANEAKPLFRQHCASCHGDDMHGKISIGAPNLTDKVWLYGYGGVYDIQRTIMYGIRSGNSKSHHITHMPAFGLTGQLTPAQIREVVQYVLKLSGRPYRVTAANAGKKIFYNGYTGNCSDCHASDARGDTAYGAPDLTINVWNSGSSPEALYRAIYYGEHHMMPAWINKLSLEQIRALAVYIYSVSHPGTLSSDSQ